MTPAVIPDAPYRADSTFVGRANELRLFRDAFDRMLGGRRQVVTLLGEPGIGKTRCAEVLASAAEDRGALVLWGRCYEEPGAPPYWPWVQILREYMDASSPDEVRVMMGAGLDDIACIVPELAAGGEKAATTRSMIAEPPQTRFRAFDAIGRFFVKAAQQTPLVLVIDNLHWADAPSLSLLEFLSQELQRCRVLIIGTYRDNEVSRKSPLLSTLGELSRESGIERVRLSGLPEDDIAELAGQMLGAPLPRSAVEAINHQTDGNPLFVIELVKVLIEESADVGVAPIAVRIPDGVRETVGRRLSRLPERCNELLTAASVLGRNFTAKELAAAADESLDLVLANLDTAARAGIVECHGDEPGSHRFTHALIRETLYEEIPTLDRLRLHGRVGDALTALYDARLASVVTRVAHHYYEAAPLGHTDKAAAFAMRAAESAVATYAYEEAVAHCDRAISALGLTQLDTDDRLARAHLLKGLSLTMLGDERSLETLFHAVKHALRVESAELLVDVATHLIWATCFAPQPHTVPLLEKALALLPQIDSVARAKALAALAFALRSSGDHRRIQPLVNEALEMAERLRDPAVRCWCFRFSTMALRGRPGSLPQRLSLARTYRDVARAMGDEECLSDSYAWQAENLTEAGQFAELEALLDRYENLTVARFGIHGYYVRTYRILLALLHGEWSGLEERIEQLLETGLKTRRQDAEGVHSAQMFVLNRDLGRLRALEPIVRQLTTVRGSRTWAPGLVVMCAELGLVGEARDLLDELARDGFVGVPKDDMFTASLVFTAEACCKLGDAERARTLYALLLPYADQTVNHPRAACLGGTALYLGMLARTFGDADNARKHFDAALASHRAMTAWPWLARTELHYGALLVALGSPADQAAGRELLRDAEQLASRLSMVTLLDEIGTLLSGSDAHESFRDGLTAREVEVLRLLAMGRSNKDISTVLSISLNTVATHVRSILSKTHCANRTEAAAYAIREYLQPDGARRS